MASRACLPGFRAPAVGFEQPFEMLGACHERVQRTLDLLQRLCTHLRDAGCDASARQAARDVLRYFDIAAPLHHEDEELHVFPPLLARAHAGGGEGEGADMALAALVRRLQQDHIAMAQAWAVARVPLQALADGGIDAFLPPHEAAFAQFARLYADHLRHEDDTVYPASRAALAPQTVARMGQEMARRRGAR
ncbi:MAG: hemerythrin domain-containing protein [Comamonadaceae bacterium]|nr:MAG: hemerythrin domain-containing protein [Comamonadaceae bacterium]